MEWEQSQNDFLSDGDMVALAAKAEASPELRLGGTAPAWLMNALPGYSSGRVRELWYFSLDSSGDRRLGIETSGSFNAPITTSYAVFNPSLFNNLAPASVGTSGAKTSNPTALALGGSATWSASPTNGNWVPGALETNWSTGAGNFPGATSGLTNADTATFAGASTQLLITINSSTLNVKSITFSGSAEPAYTIGSTGGNSLLLSSGGAISILSSTTGASITNSVNAPLVLEPASPTAAGTYTFSNTSSTVSHPLAIGGTVTGGTTTRGITLTLTGSNTGANTVSGIISDGSALGGFSVTKDSTGTWSLSGPAANTYTGLTSVNNGELDLAKTATFNAVPGNLTIGDDVGGANSAIVKLINADQIADTSDVTINSDGVFNLNGKTETIDALNGVAGSSVTLGSGTLTVGANNEAAANFSGVISGAGGFIKVGLGGTQILSGTNLYSGDTQILAGDLRFDSGGTSNSSTIRLGDTTGTNYAVLSLGVGNSNNVGSALEVRSGSSGAKALRSLATTGTNTYSGNITLNDNLSIESSTGGTFLFQGGSIAFNTRTLTIDSQVINVGVGPNGADAAASQGTVTMNEALTSSSATGGSLVKDGSGTLIIQSTGNTYTGTDNTALNSNGTQIKGGILGIFGDTSLGMAPSVATNNVFFAASAATNPTASRTLRADADNIVLAANRSINIASGVTGQIDSNGNTFTIAGNINGANGSLYKTGAGTLVLTGANTYTGTTTINQGTLNAAANGALGSGVGGTATGTTSIQVNSGGTLMLSNLSATDRVRDDAGITLGSGGSASIVRSGPGVVSEGSGAQVTNGIVTGGMSTVGLGLLTLQSNSTLNFGTLGVGTLTFAGFNPGTFTLTISNWTSSASLASLTSGTDGTDDRLIFAGITPPNTAFITFDGAAAAFIPLDTGFWEVVPVPETSTWVTAALALGAVVFAQRKRFAKRSRVIG
jgi:autotransporter-associated beta strand protein